MADEYANYIDGEWVESETGETFENRNPANSDDLIGYFQQSNSEDAARAAAAASAAETEWAETPGPERGSILSETARNLDDRKDELTETLVREEGKARGEAAGEVQRAIDIFSYYAEKTRDIGGVNKQSSSRHTNLQTVTEPVGVAGLITPWNYPIAIPAWKIAPALAAGNTAVFKPASMAPNVSRKLVECLDEAGLPAGVLNYVTGPGSEVGSTFATHEAVDAVSFTGSTQVGNHVYDMAAEDQKRVQLEMGGKNPVVVSKSADLDDAVEIAANGAFGVTGQACTATSRAIVHEELYDEFVDRLVERAAEIEIGPGLDGFDMGPQVTESELESTMEYIELGRDEGATLETGGGQPEGDRFDDGFFVEPTVFSDVDPDMQIAQEEIFGPVLAVIPASDFDDALEIANGVQYGLSASIVTNDLTESNRFVSEIEAGVVKINEKTTGLELHVPFGGMKASSSETFREQGDAGLDFFTISKTVYTNY
ncbi:aldehyde dehydrogenase family protein [Natronorubrum sp. JWXQ-INN-674]|uniref:Aldehyde dehydrogenase family protein n=1 Tax=Natronorubrum halalkaliphilum TaxID=2691917 RepID=A0A6B0VHJ7_9EURY|nr:aldehyde dehydrogenase family protein [Natronorubrum halalkaliphilum]MXV60547.1 aldehyde dehydrogenase family protein [Natronorubrum halalkaliphilum]